jgi:2-methylisocitrate lyase-like PEP mutase family enzyme
MSEKPSSKSAHLQELIHRRDKVLAVLHPPTAAHARIMEKAGCEALFVGTGGEVGAYTGLADVGTATMTECVTIAGWIADSVSILVIMDGDTGHGGIMAVRRMVRECIRAGVAGIRIDDQPIEGKRKTQSAGVEVVPRDQAIARYRAAVDMKNELDPNFVVMAQCYARDASNGTLEDTIARMQAYNEEARVDWVQFESPHSVDEIRSARAAVTGPFSFMKGKLGRYLDLHEHLALGVTIAWYPGFTHHVTWAALLGFHDSVPVRRREGLGGLCRESLGSALSCARGTRGWRKRSEAAGARATLFFVGRSAPIVFAHSKGVSDGTRRLQDL